MRIRRAAAGIVLAALLAASPVFAEKLEPGVMAPAVEGKEFFNIEPFKFDDLSGRVVLLEFFGTG